MSSSTRPSSWPRRRQQGHRYVNGVLDKAARAAAAGDVSPALTAATGVRMPVSEFDLIRRAFMPLATPARDDVLFGAGDDCALLAPPPGRVLAVSTDTLVAGRHFLADADPCALGHKSLMVNLGDLAAMGAGRPGSP